MKNGFFVLATMMALVGCGGSGGGGGGSSSGGRATGVLSVPSATCAGSSCISSSASLMAANATHLMAVNTSGETIFNMAYQSYTYFTDTVIPDVNTTLYQVEQAAKSEGLNTCADLEGVTAGVLDYPLGSGYTVDISDQNADLKTIPTPMTDNGTKMTKRFIFANSGTKFAEVQIKCNSATKRTFYVRVLQSSTQAFEFWAQADGNNRIIYGAMDNGSSEKVSFYFNTADGSVFQLHGVARQVTVAGATMDFSISGGADLGSGIADLIYSQDGSVLTSYSTYDADSSSVQKRHCYSSLSPLAVDNSGAACSSLISAVPAPSAIRTGTTWNYIGMGTAISTSF